MNPYNDNNNLIGKRVRCVACGDRYSSVPPGIEGKVTFVDDLGTVFVDWDNGSGLGLVPGVDRWTVLS